MKRKISKSLAVISAIFMLLSSFCIATVFAAKDVSGKCGENVTWTYNESTETLTISGSGAMYGFPPER